MRRLRPASPLKTPLRTPPTRKTQRASPHQNRRLRSPGRRSMGDGRARRGAGGAPGTIRGGSVSKSATKAPRAGIGREEKRGISTILLARPDSIRAFVADLDNPPPRTGRGGRSPVERRPGQASGRAAPGRATTTGDDHNGHPGERTGPTDHGDGLPGRSLTPKRALRTRACSSNRHSRVQNAPLDEEGAGRSHRGPRRRPRGPRRPRPPGRRFRREGLNASSARRNPPQLAQCELSSTKSTSARFVRAQLAQCELR